MPVFAAEELEQLTHALFQSAGGTREEAAIVSRHLVEANLAGHDSHGVLRIPQYLRAIQSGELKVGANMTVVSDTPTTAIVDGGRGFGQMAGHQSMRLAIQKAKQHGISAVASRNSYHTGRIASYPLIAAAEQLVAIVMVNAGGRWTIGCSVWGIVQAPRHQPPRHRRAVGRRVSDPPGHRHQRRSRRQGA